MPLTYDPATAVTHLSAADPILGSVIESVGPLTLEPSGDAFRMLSRAIFFQQLAGPAARAIMKRVLAAIDTDEDHWYTPQQMVDANVDQLRAAGLSRQKTIYIRDLAEKFATGALVEAEFAHLDDEEIIQHVTMVKGIGRWTAEMYLIFCLGRPDVLPVLDLGVQRGIKIAYGLADLPKPAEMRTIAEPWAPYRSAATWYMWRSLGVALPEQGR